MSPVRILVLSQLDLFLPQDSLTMASSASSQVAAPNTTPTHQDETTFRKYNSADAEKYAAYRPAYNPKLIELVMKHHTSTGGQTSRVLDIGCGPGTATRQIASYFQHVLGIDASPAMIAKAQDTPCPSATGEQAVFQVCNSEEIDQLYEPESIDLIAVATAAHWFDMPRFYAAAAKVLKPGGSIAMWCGGRLFVDPDTTPNADLVQATWTELEREVLRPFETPGNLLCRDLYRDLPMPWTIDRATAADSVAAALPLFDERGSMRREFNADGRPDPDPMFAGETKRFMRHFRVPLDRIGLMLGTASPVTRWREAHRDELERGEVEDFVERVTRITREELAGREWLEVGTGMVLVVVKKKS